MDLLAVLAAFEEMNKCRLTVELAAEGAHQWVSMSVQVTAWQREQECMGAPPSVLQSVRRPWALRQTLESAILQLLYALDFAFASQEGFGNTAVEDRSAAQK